MSLVLTFDRKHYSIDGIIPLKRGDDWSLDAQIIYKKGNYQEPFDLNGHSATGYFSGATGGVIAAETTITNEGCGKINLSVAKTITPNIALAEQGTSIYIIISNTSNNTVQTVETEEEPIGVMEREFRSF